MSEQPGNQDPSFRKGNLASDEVFDVSEYAELLFNDSELAELDEQERTLAIGDRIIGAIVANGTVKGSQREYTPSDILTLFDAAARQTDPEGVVAIRNGITNTSGLRKTFDLLGSNSTGSIFGQMKERAGLGQYGRGLGSIDMVEGYLNTLQEHYHQMHPNEVMAAGSAKREIKDKMEQFAGLDTEAPDSFSKTMTSLNESEIDSVRRQGNEFRMAAEAVSTWGADVELLDATANRLRAHKKAGVDIGTRAMTLAVTDYSKMWQ